MYNKIFEKLKTFLGLSLSLAFLFVLFLFSPKVYAQSESLSLNIRQKISINSPYAKPKDSFSYVMEAVNKDAPLPEGASKTYEFKIKGDSEKQLSIKYQKAGEYEYKIYQKKPDIANVKYDKEVYELYVKVIESYGKLIIREVLIKNSSDHKVSDIVFENIYEIKPDNPNQPDKPDNPDEPDKPDKPDKPDEPDKPDKPDKPDEPDKPGKPDKPDEPDKPDKPEKPDKPDIPNKPSKPDEPNKPGDQITRPEKPGKNEQSKNAKTGVEEYILPLALIVFILSLLLILTRKRKKLIK